MGTHYRNYQVLVNGHPLPFFHSVEAISSDYIEKAQRNFVEKQKELGVIKEGDKVEFVFKYCNT